MTSAPARVEDDAGGAPAQARDRCGEIAVALGLALGPAVAIGLARFAYGLLLPATAVGGQPGVWRCCWPPTACSAPATSRPAAYGSALLFGASFLAVVTAVTSTAHRSLPAHHWTPAIATLTIVFALGQCLGPVLAGVLADSASGIRAGSPCR